MQDRRSPRLSRRQLLGGLAWLAAPPLLRPLAAAAHRRTIPASGETVPAVGMGTWITFNVGNDTALRNERTEVLRAFFEHGGGMIDSSPMYGSSEAVVGYGLERLGYPSGLFSATKVWSWTGGGEEQIAESLDLWGLSRLDLEQVHNLVDWQSHLPMLREQREAGRIRYIGVTTSHGRRHAELERIMRREPLDFVQLTYNILDREAEERLLPLAADRGIAVIANRPFRRKALIRRFEGRPLPDWAGEISVSNWPQFLLKFIISHPVVTCAIPATTRVDHMRENMGALDGPLPDAELRARMARYVS
ncbi:aldo/keto reductase [Sediminicurvatus halobius]|uniref:Aldo/keto reductase n=1 Tax=Sediminicurvatus halobius TaxID=2182432 RepID=A0A2U2N8P5_9GAMM|nr:aldo/keto reductase [Spiribacter halobius]PWG65453.1 aldo/keto reductase [Spiribacter halobius]UEX76474.1 aldo/keto reductase [Spiribacter halobius]